MSAFPDPVVRGLADLGLTARPVPTPDGTALWLVTDWSAIDPAAAGMLSQAERARAEQFGPAHLRDRYRAAHVALRRAVEHQCGIATNVQEYRTGPHGKPYLLGHPDVSFSLSYGRACLLIGTAPGGAFGVDIEPLRRIEDAAELAELYFSAREQASLASHEPGSDAFDQAFLSVWTRKEACVKALGLGLGEMALARIECGSAGARAVRVGDRQLRTDTTLFDYAYLISWSWDRIGCCEPHAADSSTFVSALSRPSRMT